MYKGMDR